MKPFNIKSDATKIKHSRVVDMFFNDINTIEKLLKHTTEESLYRGALEGDKDCIQKLVQKNLRFVISVAKQYWTHWYELADAIQDGNIGLLSAADRKFNPDTWFKFLSYAVRKIRRKMQEWKRDANMIWVPFNVLWNHIRQKQGIVEFINNEQREPTPQEIWEILWVSEEEGLFIQNIINRAISLDAPLSSNEDKTGADIISWTLKKTDYDLDQTESLTKDLEYIFSTLLTKRQSEILKLFFGIGIEFPMRIEDIGDKFEVSRERARQIKEEAIETIRENAIAVNLLRKYLS